MVGGTIRRELIHREADRVSEQVMRMPEPSTVAGPAVSSAFPECSASVPVAEVATSARPSRDNMNMSGCR